ncbi:MAG: DMT family transporter [Treponemataceae bacterium]
MRQKNDIFVWILLCGAVVIASTSVLMIKAASIHPYLIASARLLGAALILLPAYFWELRERHDAGLGPQTHRDAVKIIIVPGIIIAIHFISWTVGARMTTASNSTLIVNMNPVAMPFAAFLLSGVRPTKKEIFATVIATSGVLIMGVGDFNLSMDFFLGDVICFVSMLCFSAYLAFSRRNNTDGRLWTYLVPLYAFGGILSFAATAMIPGALSVPGGKDLLLLAGLIIGPTVIGHSVLNWAMTVLRPQTVTIVNLFQFVFAVIFAFFLFNEIPAPQFYLTTVLILAGALLSVLGKTKKTG